jgi:hypothetical protein
MRDHTLKQSRNPHRTQWAAQFAVASELCKRGYEVALTMGNNTPLADLMIVSPETKKQFLVDVKGRYLRNAWRIKRREGRDNFFYVLAYVPNKGSNQFFILKQGDVHTYVEIELKRLKKAKDHKLTGISWKQAENHQDRWEILPR